jgi:hypothetical protein
MSQAEWQVMLILSHSCINFNCAIFVILLLHSLIPSRNNHTLCYRFLYQCLNLRTLFKRQYRSSLLVHILSTHGCQFILSKFLISRILFGGWRLVNHGLSIGDFYLQLKPGRENLTNGNLTQVPKRTPKPLNHGGAEVRSASRPRQG